MVDMRHDARGTLRSNRSLRGALKRKEATATFAPARRQPTKAGVSAKVLFEEGAVVAIGAGAGFIAGHQR